LINRIGCNDAMNNPSLAYQTAPVPCRCFKHGAPKCGIGDRVEDNKTHKRGRVTFVYSEIERGGEVIEVLFNGRDEAVDVSVDTVRKVSTRQL
jgi:hypothetical protein